MKNYLAIPRQVPEFVRTEYPTFIEFLKAYYKWYQQEYLANQDLEDIVDIDSAAAEFMEYFRGQLDLYGITLKFDNRTYIKRLKEMYAAKGTFAGIEFLLQLVYDQDAVVSTPWDSVFKTSTGAWSQLNSIIVTNVNFQGHIIQDFAGNLISFQTAPDANLNVRIYETFVREVLPLPNDRYEIYVTRFSLNELLDSFTITLGDDIITGSVYNSATSVSVTAGGEGFAIGQVFIVNENLNPTFNAGNNQINGDGIYVKVKDVTPKGSIKAVDMYQFGTDYDFNDAGQFTVAFVPTDAEVTSASQSFVQKSTIEYSAVAASTRTTLFQYGFDILSNSTENIIYLDKPLDTLDGVTLNKKWVVPYENFDPVFNLIVILDHGFETGDVVCYSSDTNFVQVQNAISGNTGSVNYTSLNNFAWYIIVKDKNAIQLAKTYDDAISGTAINFNCNVSAEDTSFFYKGFDRVLIKNEVPSNRNGIYQLSLDNKTLTRILTPSVAENALEEVPVGLHDYIPARTIGPNTFPYSLDLCSYVDSDSCFNAAVSRDGTITSPAGGAPLKMEPTANDPYTNWAGFTEAAAGQTWTFSVWIKASTACSAGIYIFGLDSGGGYIELFNPMWSATTTWQEFTYSVSLVNVDTMYLAVRFDGPDLYVPGRAVWYDGLRVTKTNGVNVSENIIETPTAHGLETGALISYTANGTAITTSSGSLADGSYYIVRKNDTSFWLASSHANAISGQVIDLTGTGNAHQNFVVPAVESTLLKAKGSTVYITGGDYYSNTHWAQTNYVASLNTSPITSGGEDISFPVYFEGANKILWYVDLNDVDFTKLFVGMKVSGSYMPYGTVVTGWGYSGPNHPYITISNTNTWYGVGYHTQYINIQGGNFFNKNRWVKSGDVAKLTFNRSSMRNYTGSYTTNYNVLGDSVPIQDSFYYQAFSYVTSLEIPLKEYAGLLRSTMHPAGTRQFGKYNLSYTFEPTISASSDLNLVLNATGVADYTTTTDQQWHFDILHIIFTDNPDDPYDYRDTQYIRPFTGQSLTNQDGNTNRIMQFVKGDKPIGTANITPNGDRSNYNVQTLDLPMVFVKGDKPIGTALISPNGDRSNVNTQTLDLPMVFEKGDKPIGTATPTTGDRSWILESGIGSVTKSIGIATVSGGDRSNAAVKTLDLPMVLVKGDAAIGTATISDSPAKDFVRHSESIGAVTISMNDPPYVEKTIDRNPNNTPTLGPDYNKVIVTDTTPTYAAEYGRNPTNLAALAGSSNNVSLSDAYILNINKGAADSLGSATYTGSMVATDTYVLLYATDSNNNITNVYPYWDAGYYQDTQSITN